MKLLDLPQSIVDFDRNAALMVNTLVDRVPNLDRLAVLMLNLPLLKFVPVIALFYWLWHDGDDKVRSRLFATFASAFVALGLVRLLAHALPFRWRPLHDANIVLNLPAGMNPHEAQYWSSFPSDHAAMLGALAAGLWLIRPAWGWAAGAWGVVMVLLPRLYAGMHYPFDLIAGLAAGIITAAIANHSLLRQPLWNVGRYWSLADSRSFSIAAFLSTYLLATNGNDVRQLLGFLKQLM